MRYSYFSDVHRHIRHEMHEVSEAAAKVDFKVESQRTAVKKKFDALVEYLKGHAEGEEMFQTPLLKAKNSKIADKLHVEHQQIEKEMNELNQKFNSIGSTQNAEQQVERGYDFYLSYTDFMCHYFQHLLGEERVIMPELQRLYTDDELRKVTLDLYPQMPKEKIEEMLQFFFPYVSAIEREVMLTDLKDSLPPETFRAAWEFIALTLEPQERKALANKFRKI